MTSINQAGPLNRDTPLHGAAWLGGESGDVFGYRAISVNRASVTGTCLRGSE